jgi:phage-related protein
VANPQVIVEFVAQVDKLKSGFREAESSATSTSSKLKGLGKAALAAAGAAGLGALVYTLHTGIEEYTQAAKVTAQTNAVIKSTGTAAHVSAQHVQDLAGSLLEKSGVDDEVIQSGENMLLTFTNIRNEAGKGNKIFDQATQATLDLSVAMGKDMQSSAVLVGKALNDPVKGLTALTRVGVTFTDAQKKAIKQMVKSGDVMGAQKVILKELQKEFGGSAEAAGKTLPGQLNILKQNFNNLAGSIVQTLAPALGTIARLFAANPALAKAVTIGVLALAAAMVALNIALAVSAVLTSEFTVPILIAVGIVAALTAAVILLVTHFNDIVDWLKQHWDIVALIVFPFAAVPIEIAKHFNEIVAAIKGPINDVLAWVKEHWDIVAIVAFPFAAVPIEIAKHAGDIYNAAWNVFNGVVKALGDTVGKVGGKVGSAFTGVANTIKNTASDTFNQGWSTGVSLTKGLASGIGAIGQNTWNTLRNIGGVIYNKFSEIFNWGWGLGANIVKGIGQGIQGAVGAVWHAVGGIGGYLWNKLDEVFNWGWSVGRAIWNGLSAAVQGIGKSIVNAIKAPINAVISAWNALRIGAFTINLPGPIPDVHFGGIDLPNLPYLAAGGVVMRPTMAVIGERGPEAVVPLGPGGAPIQVRVYIGDQELRGIVRTEVVTANNRTAQTLLAGLGA